MPAQKKQKTGNESSASTREDDANSSGPHKKDKKARDVTSIPPHEYICIHRPYFDLEAENRAAEEQDEEDEIDDKYAKIFEEEKATGTIFQPATDHKDWKWVMLWEGWKKLCDFKQRTKFCDPDNFGMYIYNDWKGYGVTELVENLVAAFDKELKKKDERLFQMWAVVSSIAHWLNDSQDGGMDFIHSDDAGRIKALNELIGCALLTTLAAIEGENELKPDSKFLDLPLVISSFLSWSDGLEDYGIEDEAIFWRPHAVEYFTKAELDPAKGVFGTAKLLETLKDGDGRLEEDASSRLEKDPWAWAKKFKAYKKHYGPGIGGSRYDITKMTRKERAKHAFDKKDPLRHIPEKDIKEGNLDIA